MRASRVVTGMKSIRTFAGAMKVSKCLARQEPRKLAYLLIIPFMFISFGILSHYKHHYCSSSYGKSQPLVKQQLPIKLADPKLVKERSDDPDLLEDEDEDENASATKTNVNTSKPICYETSQRSDTCEAEGDVRIKASTNTIFFYPATSQQKWKIKPYARKHDPIALKYSKEWTLKPSSSIQQLPQCTSNHSVPVVLFSIGGFTGNVFHDFSDVLIPLFVSSYQFHGEIQFLVSDVKPWWISKYSLILKQLSNYKVINLDSNEKAVHCHPKAIIGPSFHKELGIDTEKSPNQYSIMDFKRLLNKAFGLGRVSAITLGDNQKEARKPRLLIISRKRTRAFLNEQAMMQMALSLGFDVKVGEPDLSTDMSKFARLVNSADVLLGVHGAGLTNMVFLPEGAVVVQIIPLGRLEWVAGQSFKEPSKDMKIKYLEYVIQEDESSLIEQYSRDDPVFKDPISIHKQGWIALRSVYLDKQNVRPHLGRLRNTLLEALKLLHHNASSP